MKAKRIVTLCFLLAIAGIIGYTVWQLRTENKAYYTTQKAIKREEAFYKELRLQRNNTATEEATTEKDVFPGTNYTNAETEMVGWLTIPDTPIDYPVLQHNDDRYYLSHAYGGYPSECGAIFVSSTCALTDDNVIIYGHNLNLSRSEIMFTSLPHYYDSTYAKEHSILYFCDIPYDIIGAVQMCTTDPNFIWLNPLLTQEEYETLLTTLEATAKTTLPHDTAKTSLLTLVTCDTALGEDGRCIIIAKKRLHK